MPLHTTSVEEIFARMQVRYAAKFERNYAGMDMAAVKADWAEVLDGFSIAAIRFALVNLPVEWPPNAAEFRAICVRSPQAKPQQHELIPAPKPDPLRLKAELERLHALLQDRSPLQWAYDLQERESSGEQLTAVQANAWRRALTKLEVGPLGAFNRPLPEELPPAMRPEGVKVEDCWKLEDLARQQHQSRARFSGTRP